MYRQGGSFNPHYRHGAPAQPQQQQGGVTGPFPQQPLPRPPPAPYLQHPGMQPQQQQGGVTGPFPQQPLLRPPPAPYLQHPGMQPPPGAYLHGVPPPQNQAYPFAQHGQMHQMPMLPQQRGFAPMQGPPRAPPQPMYQPPPQYPMPGSLPPPPRPPSFALENVLPPSGPPPAPPPPPPASPPPLPPAPAPPAPVVAQSWDAKVEGKEGTPDGGRAEKTEEAVTQLIVSDDSDMDMDGDDGSPSRQHLSPVNSSLVTVECAGDVNLLKSVSDISSLGNDLPPRSGENTKTANVTVEGESPFQLIQGYDSDDSEDEMDAVAASSLVLPPKDNEHSHQSDRNTEIDHKKLIDAEVNVNAPPVSKQNGEPRKYHVKDESNPVKHNTGAVEHLVKEELSDSEFDGMQRCKRHGRNQRKRSRSKSPLDASYSPKGRCSPSQSSSPGRQSRSPLAKRIRPAGEGKVSEEMIAQQESLAGTNKTDIFSNDSTGKEGSNAAPDGTPGQHGPGDILTSESSQAASANASDRSCARHYSPSPRHSPLRKSSKRHKVSKKSPNTCSPKRGKGIRKEDLHKPSESSEDEHPVREIKRQIDSPDDACMEECSPKRTEECDFYRKDGKSSENVTRGLEIAASPWPPSLSPSKRRKISPEQRSSSKIGENEAVEANKQLADGSKMTNDNQSENEMLYLGQLYDDRIAYIKKTEESPEINMKQIREAYDAFLLDFPSSVRYWKKYADLERRFSCFNEVLMVYERAILVIPYSVEIWSTYCEFAVLAYTDDDIIRSLFERALTYVGDDYSSAPLWDLYLKFEDSRQAWSNMASIYSRILQKPIEDLDWYFICFKHFASAHYLDVVLTPEEAVEYKAFLDKRESEDAACREAGKDAALTEEKNLQLYLSIWQETYENTKRNKTVIEREKAAKPLPQLLLPYQPRSGFGMVTLSLPEFLGRNLHVKEFAFCLGNIGRRPVATPLGTRLLRAVYRYVTQQLLNGFCWAGFLRPEDILVSFDGSVTSDITCYIMKPALYPVNVTNVDADNISLEGIFRAPFTLNGCLIPYLKHLFLRVDSPPAAIETDLQAREDWVNMIRSSTVFSTLSSRRRLIRNLHKLYRNSPFPYQVQMNMYFRHERLPKLENLIKNDPFLAKRMKSFREPYNVTKLVAEIRHFDAHAVDDLKEEGLLDTDIEETDQMIDIYFEFLLPNIVRVLNQVASIDPKLDEEVTGDLCKRKLGSAHLFALEHGDFKRCLA
ncbi:hypothetical protein ACP70R_048732 [Stipagrostis hirtigluma subsp. patula]